MLLIMRGFVRKNLTSACKFMFAVWTVDLAAVELALARFRQPKLAELCSLDRPSHSFHVYAVSISR